MNERCVIINYLISQYFKNDPNYMATTTGYNLTAINNWMRGEVIPNYQTINYIFSCIFTPEFKIIKEFYEIDSNQQLRPQLSSMYQGHENTSGIYALYDSMVNLIYLGKAANLLNETYNTLLRTDEIQFPAGINNRNIQRQEVTKYISAYEVKSFENFDYPKHVESLLLRISKPRMNRQIGILEQACIRPQE